jgi:hypothetical protein
MIKDCDPFSGQKIAHDLRFVGWDTVVEERPGTLLLIFRPNSKESGRRDNNQNSLFDLLAEIPCE